MKTKVFLILFIAISLLSCSNDSSDDEIPYSPNIHEGDIYLDTQEAVNEFGSHHYEEIQGHLTIQGLQNQDIYNLSPLNDLKVVHGDVNIKQLPLENLRGLEGLQSIEGKLFLYGNLSLKSLNGLESLTHITGNIELFSNLILEDISGLQNVREFRGGLQVESTKIREINILQDATHLENLYLALNLELHDISGLQNVIEIQDFLDIDGNESLLNFNDLSAIKHIRGYVFISSSEITDLGLTNLESVNGELVIDFTPGITNLDDLSNLRSFGSLNIWANTSLTDFCGISTAVLNMNIPIEISDNPYNPTLEDFINGDCSQ